MIRKRQPRRKANELTPLKGKTCGHLLVLFKVAQGRKRRPQWRCECLPCGRRITVAHNRLIDKKRPKTHCGCLNKGLPTLFKKEYHAWSDAKARCHVKHHPTYPAYGAKGIRMCREWRDSFQAFLDHIGPRPSNEHSLDRRDPYGNYEPGNVRWATTKQQARNKKQTKYIKHPKTGKSARAADVAEELGMRYQSFRQMMIDRGEW